MILGLMSDTHGIGGNALAHIAMEFKKRKVEMIIHAGDITKSDIEKMKVLFVGLPVMCALTHEQVAFYEEQEKERRKKEEETHQKIPSKKPSAPGLAWEFTQPEHRVRRLPNGFSVYLGHKRGFRFLFGSIQDLIKNLQEIQYANDNVRFFISGHTHRQVFYEADMIDCINPGAIADSPGIGGGHEFAILDTDTRRITFSRIPLTKNQKENLKLAVISDSLDISQTDPYFWIKLTDELQRNNVTHIVHCGNISPDDIGIRPFESFEVYYNANRGVPSKKPPANWYPLEVKEVIDGRNIMNFEIKGHYFSVQLELGAGIRDKSEKDLDKLSQEIKTRYPEVRFIFCGMSRDAFLEEGQNVFILNPGDIFKDRGFVIIDLPLCEITFDHIPTDPLPEI